MPHIYRLATTALRRSRPCACLLQPAPILSSKLPTRRKFTSLTPLRQEVLDRETSVIQPLRNEENKLSATEAATAVSTPPSTAEFPLPSSLTSSSSKSTEDMTMDEYIEHIDSKMYWPEDPAPGDEGEDQHDPDIPDWEADDVTTMAHGEIEQHREFRQYARLAMWEMPKLTKFATPFVPPTDAQVLKFRYTSYMGVEHPGAKKVVMAVDIPKLKGMNGVQIQKLKKLCGPRYDPVKKVFTFSCDSFETQAQNKKYLSDLFDSLIVEAKDMTDTFADMPIDLRHVKRVRQPTFPDKWKLPKKQLLRRRHKDWAAAPQEDIDSLNMVTKRFVPKQIRRVVAPHAPMPRPGPNQGRKEKESKASTGKAILERRETTEVEIVRA